MQLSPKHRSSILVAAIIGVTVTFGNAVGTRMLRCKFGESFDETNRVQVEYGWPFTFLTRVQYDYPVVVSSASGTGRQFFETWRNCGVFSLRALLANCVIGSVIAIAGSLVFVIWRRQRKSIWQVHTRDLLGALVVLCSLLTLYSRLQNQCVKETNVLRQLTETPGLKLHIRQFASPTWLHLVVQWNHDFNRPFEVEFENGGDWSRLGGLPSIRSVVSKSHATTEDLAYLNSLPRLEKLSIINPSPESGPEDWSDEQAELPSLPNLRGLYLTLPANHCRRVDRLNGLEVLRIGLDCIDHQLLNEIGTLSRLRVLIIEWVDASDDLSFLPSLSELKSLTIGGNLSRTSLKAIGQSRQLESLTILGCNFGSQGLERLSGLVNIKYLDLSGSRSISDRDLVAFRDMKSLRELRLARTNIGEQLGGLSKLDRLEELDLNNTSIRGPALAPLAALKQLRSLHLRGMALDDDALTYLRQLRRLKRLGVDPITANQTTIKQSLPNCEVYVDPIGQTVCGGS